MAEKLFRELVDDLDGSPAAETLRFGYHGRDYEIDLNEKHAHELDEFLAPYLEHARRAGPVRAPARPVRRSQRDAAAIRQWARERGLAVSPRGRIPVDVLAQYEAALRSRATD